MIVSLVINLYTSRLILQALGIVDFGVYNVVGGVVLLFTIFTGPLSDSTRRFLSFEIGTQNKKRLTEVLSVSVLLHLVFSIFVVLLTESIGYWFVQNVLDIPADRLTAALWVLHFSVLSILFSILLIPYRADIIAHERMDAFAIISLIDIFLKLFVAIALLYYSSDKLILYSFLLALVSFLALVLNWGFCRLRFEEAKGKRIYNRQIAKDLLSFIGWTMTGGISGTCNNQGINMLLNVFFGASCNAARGIALQVQSAIISFSTNIQQAINPQITISYAANNLDGMHKLVEASSKYTYLLMFVISLPIFYHTPYILQLWLGEYPQYTVAFVRVVLLLNLIEVLSGPLVIANHSTGRIKKYQIVVESVLLLTLPVSYMYLKFVNHNNPNDVYYITLVFAIIAHCVRVSIVLPNIKMKLSQYLRNIIKPITIISFITIIVSGIVDNFVNVNEFHKLLLVGSVGLISCCLSMYYIAFTDDDKLLLKKQLNKCLYR